ncbi:MAG TPA: hypothetical protein ENK23_06545 [Sorangium sp.]|nr:hypothetical protein [Sorangium sp.]
MGAPAGPAGTALSCHGDYQQQSGKPRLRLAAAYSSVGTEVRFSDDFEPTLRRRSAGLALEYQLLDWMSLRASAGLSLHGDIARSGERYQLTAGPFASVGANFTVLDGRQSLPFLVLGASLAASYAETRPLAARDADAVGLSALDLRFSAVVGKLLLNAIGPYLAARAFGGPIWWQHHRQAVVGTDLYHYQFGAGVLVTSRALDVFFEIAPLGERAGTFGLASSF